MALAGWWSGGVLTRIRTRRDRDGGRAYPGAVQMIAPEIVEAWMVGAVAAEQILTRDWINWAQEHVKDQQLRDLMLLRARSTPAGILSQLVVDRCTHEAEKQLRSEQQS